jgi:hypothetical protein
MPHDVAIQLVLPADLDRFHLPAAVNERLQELLDRQDRGDVLSSRERSEAEGLVNVAELLSLLRLSSKRLSST